MNPSSNVLRRLYQYYSLSVAFVLKGAFLLGIVMLYPTANTWAQQSKSTNDLSSLSLEGLMEVRVTSVSRRESQLRKAASAVFVITQDDIRRSGAADLAEVLRLAPGVEVARMGSSVWAISIRGFNSRYANKLLVLIDGRTVYDPMYSGVHWHLQNLVLEDIDRIEVTRGPGATMWGTNAVNGVISITTKRAADTQGGLISAAVGSERLGDGSVRFGGSIGDSALYRLSMSQTTASSFEMPSGGKAGDSWNLTKGHFRLDWEPSQRDSLTFELGGLRGAAGTRTSSLVSLWPAVYETGTALKNIGAHFRTRWTRTLDRDSEITVQFYYEDADHHSSLRKHVHTTDFDLQHTFEVGPRNDVVWGIGYRRIHDDAEPSLGVTYEPNSTEHTILNLFLQDEVAVLEDRLFVSIGAKLERKPESGTYLQPSFRDVWLPTARHSAWAAISKADRTPNRSDRGLRINAAPVSLGPRGIGLLSIQGSENTKSERLTAYEGGHRYQANRSFSIDTSVFYNIYKDLSTLEPGTPYIETTPSPGHTVIPQYFANRMNGETYGAEVVASYKAADFWTLRGSYSLLRMQLHRHADSRDQAAEAQEGASPQNQFQIESVLSLPKSLELVSHAYVTGRLPAFELPARMRLDMNVTWSGAENISFSIMGHNLLSRSHREFGKSAGFNPSSVNRSVYGKISWKF